MELTPFEKLAAHREKITFQSTALNALMDLLEREEECQAQIKYYFSLSGSMREEERDVTLEAMKDARALNEAIVLICQNININA